MPPTAPADWSLDEVEPAVADYFAMLRAELSTDPYKKAEHYRALRDRIGRRPGAAL